MPDVTVAPKPLEHFAAEVLRAVGMPTDGASIVAASLVDTSLAGVDSHGIVRLFSYVTKIVRGGTNPRPSVRVERDSAATAVIDGDNGMGQVVGEFAMRDAMARAERFGVGMAVVKRSEHFGAAAFFARMASDRGMIGFASTNTPPVMAPWGGMVQAIGNNPIAIAIPTLRPPEIVLDISMSRVSGGRVRLAAKKGERIPEGWIVDAQGVPSTDPADLPEGALLAEGHKGYGLAVIVEVLCGALSGAGMLSEIPNWLFQPTRATNTGHAFVAVAIDHFVDRAEFLERVEKMRDELHAVRPAAGVARVLLPGDIEAAIAGHRSSGITVPAEVHTDLLTLGRRYGIDTTFLEHARNDHGGNDRTHQKEG